MKKNILFMIVALGVVSCTQQPGDPNETSADQLKSGIQSQHPATYYILANKLFAEGKKDEALRWFYAGQIRYRYHLAANPGLDPSGDPALFASLSETVGRPLNEYGFGDIPGLAKIIDEALAWDATHDNSFTPKTQAPHEYEETRSGLEKMKQNILANQAGIRKQRQANGLPNRN